MIRGVQSYCGTSSTELARLDAAWHKAHPKPSAPPKPPRIKWQHVSGGDNVTVRNYLDFVLGGDATVNLRGRVTAKAKQISRRKHLPIGRLKEFGRAEVFTFRPEAIHLALAELQINHTEPDPKSLKP